MYLVCTKYLPMYKMKTSQLFGDNGFSIKRENDAKGFLILLFFQTINSNLTQINFRLDVTKYSNYNITSRFTENIKPLQIFLNNGKVHKCQPGLSR